MSDDINALIERLWSYGTDDSIAAAYALASQAERLAEVERERDEARAYAAEVRIREKTAEDARIAAEDRLAEVGRERDEARAWLEDANAAKEVVRGERNAAEARLAEAVGVIKDLLGNKLGSGRKAVDLLVKRDKPDE